MSKHHEIGFSLRRRILYQIEHGHYKWIKSDDEWDYYSGEPYNKMRVRVHKETKTVQVISDE